MNPKVIWGLCCWLWAGAVAAQQPVAVGAAQTRLVVYRPAGDGLKGAAEVQVQGRHHTVLTEGTFSDMCVLAGDARLTAQLLPPTAARSELPLAMTGGGLQYLRMAVQDAQPVLVPVDEAQARQDLKGLRLQVHTLSRAGMPCSADPAPLMQSVLRETLATGAAWSTEGNSLTETGMLALGHLVTRGRREFDKVTRVRVVAHVADANDAAQVAAAQQRAELVQQLLKARAGNDWPLSVQVQPLATSTLAGCGGVTAAQMAQACPVGPRLVVLELVGERR